MRKKMGKTLMNVLMMAFFITPAALAEEAGAAQAYTWETLGTVAGATAATLMIVQLIKAPLDRVWKVPTRLVVYFVALLLLLAAQGFGGGLTVQTASLAAVNAVMVALSAYGSYEVAFGKEKGE